MYRKIIIKTSTGSAQIKTNAYYSIYNFLRDKGYSHKEAEEVASWAHDVSCGYEYELDGAEIYIVE